MPQQFLICRTGLYMKKLLVILFLLIIAFASCDKPPIPKPKKLIKEKEMIKMLVDIHLAEATYQKMRFDSIMKNFTSVDYYYSILDKYEVADSVFEKSFVYYASNPRQFEQMYRKVMNKLSEMEQQYSGRKEELQFELPK